MHRMKTVLTEEEYMERLGAILKRDFFPSIQEDEDFDFSDPEKLSITDFQTLFTTEDNASFEELLSRENERKRKKFERIHGGPALLVDDPNRRLLLTESVVDGWKFKGGKGNGNGNGNGTRLLMDGEQEHSKINLNLNVQNTRFPCSTDKNGNRKSTTTSLNRFRIPPSPAREQLAHSLTLTLTNSPAMKVSKSEKNHKNTCPLYNMDDLKALTPRRRTKK